MSENGTRRSASSRNIATRAVGEVWHRVKDFSGLEGDATYLWPRWIVLRAVGFVFVLVFAGIIDQGQVLVGPHGLIPLGDFFAQLHAQFSNGVEAFIRAPSLFFWLGTSAGSLRCSPGPGCSRLSPWC